MASRFEQIRAQPGAWDHGDEASGWIPDFSSQYLQLDHGNVQRSNRNGVAENHRPGLPMCPARRPNRKTRCDVPYERMIKRTPARVIPEPRWKALLRAPSRTIQREGNPRIVAKLNESSDVSSQDSSQTLRVRERLLQVDSLRFSNRCKPWCNVSILLDGRLDGWGRSTGSNWMGDGHHQRASPDCVRWPEVSSSTTAELQDGSLHLQSTLDEAWRQRGTPSIKRNARRANRSSNVHQASCSQGGRRSLLGRKRKQPSCSRWRRLVHCRMNSLTRCPLVGTPGG